MERKITLQTPKQINEHTQITGATLDYCYFKEDGITAYMNGGNLNEHIPLEGLSESDRTLSEEFVAMLCRVAGDEVSTGAAKKAVRAKRAAEAEESKKEKE